MKNDSKDVKFALIGGGSYGWTYKLITDIACIPALHGMHIVLHDINPETLTITRPLCQLISDKLNAGLTIEASTCLKSTIKGADFVGLTISTGGEGANRMDHAIPLKYGIQQTVGDTVGPGGWSRGLRNIPVVVDIVRQVEELAPNAWFINYSNPMTTITRAAQKISNVKSVGLCHELQGLLLHLAYFFGVRWDCDIQVKMAGINHLIWILEMDVCGQDGFQLLRDYIADPENFKPLNNRAIPEELQEAGGVNPRQHIKFDLFKRTGFLPGAGDSHTIEFFDYFLRDSASVKKWNIGIGDNVHTFAHTNNTEINKKHAEDMLRGKKEPSLKHSHEHASRIIAALLGHEENLLTPVNTGNIGQIDNLPRNAVVETMAVVNRSGINPMPVGKLPDLLTVLLMRHIPIQEMIVEAALTGNKELAIQALSLDPLTPDPDIAAKMADDFFNTFKEWLPQFNGKWKL